jgi:hypothetical protein
MEVEACSIPDDSRVREPRVHDDPRWPGRSHSLSEVQGTMRRCHALAEAVQRLDNDREADNYRPRHAHHTAAHAETEIAPSSQ